MTISEFRTKYNLGPIKVFEVDGYLYTEPIPVKLDINKNIVPGDLKDKEGFYVINYFDGYVITKDGTVQPYGIKVTGNWTKGFSLDYHTIKSTLVGKDADGRKVWNSQRPPIAEELYKLKYWKENHRTDKIARPAADFLKKNPDIRRTNVIIPVPPTDTTRIFQPVYELAKAIGRITEIPVDTTSLRKVKSTPQLKEISDPKIRREVLKDAFDVHFNAFLDKNVLVFDDLYRSGETLRAVCDVIKNKGRTKEIYVLTITKTRSKR